MVFSLGQYVGNCAPVRMLVSQFPPYPIHQTYWVIWLSGYGGYSTSRCYPWTQAFCSEAFVAGIIEPRRPKRMENNMQTPRSVHEIRLTSTDRFIWLWSSASFCNPRENSIRLRRFEKCTARSACWPVEKRGSESESWNEPRHEVYSEWQQQSGSPFVSDCAPRVSM